MNKYIKSDLFRYSGKTDCLSFFKVYLKVPAFRFQVAFRLVKTLGGRILWLLRDKKMLHISKDADIGYGLYIGHNGPVYISATAKIGDNCNISQCVTIGSSEGHAAHIGNNVFIGPNVCVVENVAIGDNATIGAGSIVVKDVPCNATVAGNYAKILNYDSPARYIKNTWKTDNR